MKLLKQALNISSIIEYVITREVLPEEKDLYNKIVNHPLQSWEWGEFRKLTGVQVLRVGAFSGKKLVRAFQLSIHQLPHLPYTIGYLPKSDLPDTADLKTLTQIGRDNNCVFIQIEPNVIKTANCELRTANLLKPSAKPLFTKYTFYIDLTKSEAELFESFQPKTRYNIRLAQKHGVTIQEENTPEAFEKYLELTRETTKRQGFYAHSLNYHRLMWKSLNLQPTTHNLQPIAHLFTARYRGKILAAWILFLFNHVLYYPYGASSAEHKEVMASNLLMWEAIRFGKKHGAKIFDLWGTPGPNPQPSDSYYGFHRFKLGYSPQLIEFIGSYDLVIKQTLYKFYVTADKLRWSFLKLKTKL